MTIEWISIHERMPPQGIEIRIKAESGNDVVETQAVFKIYDIDEKNEAFAWYIKKEDAEKYGTVKPTHWMP